MSSSSENDGNEFLSKIAEAERAMCTESTSSRGAVGIGVTKEWGHNALKECPVLVACRTRQGHCSDDMVDRVSSWSMVQEDWKIQEAMVQRFFPLFYIFYLGIECIKTLFF